MTAREDRVAAVAAATLLLVAGACATARRVPAPEASEPELPSVVTEPSPHEPVDVEPAPPVVVPAPVPLVAPASVRVGLATDLESVTLPCCEGEVVAELGGERWAVVAPVTVRPAAESASPPVWRLQVAAVREPGEASALARRIGRLSGIRADARFDAASGLYRVRLGTWSRREAAEAAGKKLQGLGLDAFWVVSEGAGLVAPALEVSQGARTRRIDGRRFVLHAPEDGGLRVDGSRYRGAIVVFLNARGRLNLINELPLEQYLRGVVPRELGPGAYPEIEALKAQAVAARSYTLRNLGEFEDEGFDLCGTPKCQVYGGLGAEHPLSDRAVADTAGEVLVYEGRPIDALYSATCGGRTEDVEVVFPLKSAPYLRGVPCIEAGLARLGPAPPGESWPESLLARALPESPVALATAGELEASLRRLAVAAGLPAAPDDRLASLERREVHRFLASLFDLALDARLFVLDAEVDYLLSGSAAGWSEPDRRLAAWLAKSGLLRATDEAPELGADEARELMLRLAVRLRVLERRPSTFDALRAGDLLVREGESETGYHLSPEVLLFHDAGDGPRPGELILAAGDGLDLYFAGDALVAVVQQVHPDGAAFDRAHARSRWTRFKTREDLARSIAPRFPGFEFADFDVVSRGPSGRVGRLRLIGRDGETVEVAGLAVRWALDLPDTLFTVRRLTPPRGRSGWQFTGRGWGHGVGLCQVGAYGMARRGHGYREILAHYYTGAEIARLEPE